MNEYRALSQKRFTPPMRMVFHSLIYKGLVFSLLLSLIASGCVTPEVTQELIEVSIDVDGQTIKTNIPAGSTVQNALENAGITLGELDRSEPPFFTLVTEETNIRIIRVTEKFEIVEEIIPFESQTLRNESLPLEEEILIQRGKNGRREITYRRVFEDGVEITDQAVPVKEIIIEPPIPEIRMVGIQSPFAPISLPGKLFYLRDGNLWMMDGSTANRFALVTTGDLDGRVLSISRDSSWLLFTRTSTQEEVINELWAASLESLLDNPGNSSPEDSLINLGVENVIHFADWMPGSTNRVIFSTVEPRSAPPGWQANNDLLLTTFSTSGWTTKWTTYVEANAGGIYGWWGTKFHWSPQGDILAYSRPDGIGFANLETGVLTETLKVTPLNTHADWAWVPGFDWSPDGRIIYTVDHVSTPGSTSAEDSPIFNLIAYPIETRKSFTLVSQVGMFAYPIASPLIIDTLSNQSNYFLAYLQALFPQQSQSSRYQVVVMDRDGSNQLNLFPSEELLGLEPRENWGAWSPQPLPESGNMGLIVIYEGNLWLIDVVNRETFQITADGLTSKVLWVK